jgi:tetraacyldisaccharide 4'-kinase
MPPTRSILLLPLSLIWRLITDIRNFLYNSGILKSEEFGLPVICIGNLAAGGTGKTPHTEYLVSLLSYKFKVAVLSRGYKRKTRGFILAGDSSTVYEIGDEPLQMKKKFPDLIVAVDSNRARGIKEILAREPDISVILLDDAYQHRRITPGFSILLSDYERLYIHDRMLPYGNLRESSDNMGRADIILITKSPDDISPIQRRIIVKDINKAAYQNLYFTSVAYKNPKPVFKDAAAGELVLSAYQADSRSALIVTGIANPRPLVLYLEKFFKEIKTLEYPDHHAFTVPDISRIEEMFSQLSCSERYVITTEKDSVRFLEFTNIAAELRISFYFVPIGIRFLNDDQAEFDNIITDYVRKNKRNNRVS